MGVLEGIKIGVLGGGVSGEREISLVSAAEVAAVLDRNNVGYCYIDICLSDENKIRELILSQDIDLAFIALHGGLGEDGTIQRILDELGIPYTGSGSKASALAMDKISSKKIFLEEGVSTKPFLICGDSMCVPSLLKYPLVVKPYSAGSSLGVSVVKEEDRLKEALQRALSLQSKALLEEYIDGREFSVGILDWEPLGVVEIITKRGYFDFDAKYNDSDTKLSAPAALNSELYSRIQQLSLKAHSVLGCRHFSRVDIMVDKTDTPYVLEVNSIPGLTPHSLLPLSAACRGITFDDLILRMAAVGYCQNFCSK